MFSTCHFRPMILVYQNATWYFPFDILFISPWSGSFAKLTDGDATLIKTFYLCVDDCNQGRDFNDNLSPHTILIVLCPEQVLLGTRVICQLQWEGLQIHPFHDPVIFHTMLRLDAVCLWDFREKLLQCLSNRKIQYRLQLSFCCWSCYSTSTGYYL